MTHQNVDLDQIFHNPEVKDLVGTRTKKQTKEILNSERKTRAQTVEAGMTLRKRK